jgi:hypothetical protein
MLGRQCLKRFSHCHRDSEASFGVFISISSCTVAVHLASSYDNIWQVSSVRQFLDYLQRPFPIHLGKSPAIGKLDIRGQSRIKKTHPHIHEFMFLARIATYASRRVYLGVRIHIAIEVFPSAGWLIKAR